MSEWSPKLAAAYVKAFSELSAVTKDRAVDTGQYGYTYADLEAVLSKARPILSDNGLAISQDVTTVDRSLNVATTIVHESGESVTLGPLGFPAGGTPQQGGSAITYARRYALLAALGVATEDDDGQKAAEPPPKREPTRIDRLMDRLANITTEQRSALKTLSAANGAKTFSRDDFDGDTAWLQKVEAALT
jgi:hypothetical protein